MVGREEQIKTMKSLFTLNKSYFVAITGRRRVGKTYLIDHVYGNHICFRATGIQDRAQNEQIRNFTQKLAEYSTIPIVTIPKNWQEVFTLLKKYLQTLPKNKKQVIFLDELPWMATVRSGFVQLLAHLWNDYLSKEKHFILVICGSATSWISKKIIGDKGGFHNRISHHISLSPFTLSETKEFLLSKKIKWVHSEIAELYMTLGGIPYYLDMINRGESATQAIDRLCFAEDGLLKTEYTNLYRALFDQSVNHEAIVSSLAKSKMGLGRLELSRKSKVEIGGPFSRTMEDLIVSGFVVELFPFNKKKQGTIYLLADEYSVFYHKFIAANKKSKSGMWQVLCKSQSYKIWLGHAFESLCIRHISKIKKALHIAKVYTDVSSISYKGNDENAGFQIDFIIDRDDKTVNLCECKYYNEPFEISKQYAATLVKRKELFIETTNTKKNVFNTLITNKVPKNNFYFEEAFDNFVSLDALF